MSTRTKKIYRITAAYLALNLLAEICWPTAAYALTNGPGQPEFQSFEPAGTTEMVNLFTGDFNYNIPLMTVPGPNGGYPINLAYHAGISMEQEASWTGLGWNINAGAINRAMRGLPDDFNGDQVVKELHYKPNTTFSLNLGASATALNIKKELLGFSAASTGLSVQLYYNNYRGLGYQFGLSLSDLSSATATSESKASPFKLNLTSSSDGIGVNVDYSHFWKKGEGDNNMMYGWFTKAGLSWASREGLSQLSLGGGWGYSDNDGKINSHYIFPAGVSFSKSAYVPTSTPEMTGFISMLGVSIGEEDIFDYTDQKSKSLNASYTRTWVKHTSQSQYSYGYLHAENSESIYEDNRLEDINREKDVAPGRQTKTLGVPVATYDVFSVSGQGVGGAFRPYRSDIGIYSEPKTTSTIRGGKLGFEYGTVKFGSLASFTHWGADGSYTQSQSYSGMWDNQWWNNGGDHGWSGVEDYQFIGSADVSADHAYEPYYFKMSGEQTATPTTQLDFIGGELNAVRFGLKEKYEPVNGNQLGGRPEINDDRLYDDISAYQTSFIDLDNTKNHRAAREKRIVSNQSRTNGQLKYFASFFPANIYTTANVFPATGGTPTTTVYDYSARPDHHIGEFTEVNPDGNRYVYGIPVYNLSTKDVYFAKESTDLYPTRDRDDYTSTQASTGNVEPNTDQFYSSTTLPGYAESFLLTAIYSPDYIDITGDGPSTDDLGYYVKFNYVKSHSAFQWRAPYKGAAFNAGYLSNKYDDKLSYQYGTKEIYYLHSVETKTHVACFVLQSQAREDGHAAVSEDAQSTITDAQILSAGALYALDKISLYSKADPDYGTANATPLKSVHFTYTNTLCPGVYNNHTSTNDGKLTLASLYFTYRNNEKGKLSPYEFEYIDAAYQSDLQNPGYNPVGNDRWGCYKAPNTNPDYPNQENPYVDQKTANRTRTDQSAAAWSLKKIKLPSGSEIKVNYEADDYAYVQDKKAMQMCRVVGTGEPPASGEPTINTIGNSLTKKNTLLFFELNTTIDPLLPLNQKRDSVYKYIAGIEDMYFKVFTELKNFYGTDDKAFDYVDGFCKISKETGSYGVVDDGAAFHRFGFVTIERVERDDYPNLPGNEVHPFRKAAWQHIYLERPDLFTSPYLESTALVNLGLAATAMVAEIPRAIAPYITAFSKGWASKIDINTGDQNFECYDRPSYIRLNNPRGCMVGGGHRVKSITISDAWNSLSGAAGSTGEYGQEYIYKKQNENGEIISSGVAAYEPMIGGEEIALRLPIRYNSDNLVKKDAAFYVTEPMGERYYPAPIVGYSRVIVRSIVGDADAALPANRNKDLAGAAVTKSRTGQTEYEFYTAKDYPVLCDRTGLQKTWFPIPIFLPFIGSITYNNRGFSQGYSVLLNDMHGKLKAVSTHPYSVNLVTSDPIPVRRVFYKYNGIYTEGNSNVLSPEVTILTSDGNYAQANLGETYDFFTDMRQHSNETKEFGIQNNLTLNTINGFTLPTLLPLINISRSLYRSVVAMKVVYRTGILTEVETIDDGSRSVARNLMFDGETGAPLLTTVENEFKRPIYTYNYAGHWAYDGMKGAYHNIGVTLNNMTTNSSGQYSVTGAEDLYFPGDEVMYIPNTGTGSSLLWVKTVSGNTVTFMDADGSSTSANVASLGQGTFTIVRSGYRNLQSVGNGIIVSLTNPLEGREFPLFAKLNTLSTLAANTVYSFTDCATGDPFYFEMFVSGNTLYFDETTSGGVELGCRSNIVFPSSYTLTNITQLNGCKFYKAGNTVTVDFPSSADVLATWSDPSHCFNECLDNVLHAAAVRFSDDWSANVTDKRQAINFDDAGLSVASGFNQYKYAQKGVWRTESNFLYQVDRIQTTASTSATNISKDGTYDNFVLYDWVTAAENNDRWSHVSRVTRYSPYGYALESRDALGIFSSTMFGYNSTKQTAAASNCQYFELGFDGFEDYPTNSYPEDLDPTGGVTPWGHGHLFFDALNVGTPPNMTSTYAHTGVKSLAVEYGGDAQFSVSSVDGIYPDNQKYFEPQPGQKYNLSMWVRATGGGTPAVEIANGSSTTTYTPDNSVSAIEGWKKIDVSFVAPAASGTLTITLKCQTSGYAFFDDIRIQPFKSGMVSYVYDPQTHWLLAELDNRNFATFYNYDEEGSLVQVKQETEKGIFTVKTSRSNIKK